MEKYLISTLEKGKFFNQPLYLDDNYILLSPETPISEQLIARLAKWDYNYVHSNGSQVDGLSAGDSKSDAFGLEVESKEQTEFAKAQATYVGFIKELENVFTDFINKNMLSSKTVAEIVKKIIESVKEQKNYLLRLSEMPVDETNYLIVHSARSTIIAVAIGLALKFPAHKLMDLGIAACMHEIGMMKLPPSLYLQNKILTPQEKKVITTHTIIGFKLLKTASFSVPVCLAVLESHENVDGTGYPRQITGDKISQYGKIVSIVSTFAALSSPRPFRLALDGHQTIIEILRGRKKRYDDDMVLRLVSLLSLYPLGTWVLLANGAIGMVIQTNEQNPKEPVVRVMVSPVKEKLIDTLVVKTDVEYRIARALNVQQVLEIKKTYSFT